MTGTRAQRPVQAPGRKGEEEDQTWAVKAQPSKEGRGPEGKDRWAGTIWETVAGRHVGLAKF